MRILRIFGVVVAVHLTAFLFLFAIPGCRSTTRKASSQKPVVESKETTVSFPGLRRSNDTTPMVAPAPVTPAESPSAGGTIVFPGVSGQSPTRPSSSEAQTVEKSAAPQGRSHTVVARDSLWSIAKKYGISEKELAAANKLRPGAPLRVGQILKVPDFEVPAAGESVSVPAATFSYRVKAGDSLVSIAKRAGVTTSQLKEMNKLSSDIVRVGQELTLPATLAAVPPSGAPAGEVGAAKAPKPPKPGMQRHVVRPGETLGEIARKYGVLLRDVATVNHIANPASLRVGAELWIPAPSNKTAALKETPAAAAATPAPTPTPTPVDNPFITPVGGNDSPISPASDSPVTGADEPLITPAK